MQLVGSTSHVCNHCVQLVTGWWMACCQAAACTWSEAMSAYLCCRQRRPALLLQGAQLLLQLLGPAVSPRQLLLQRGGCLPGSGQAATVLLRQGLQASGGQGMS